MPEPSKEKKAEIDAMSIKELRRKIPEYHTGGKRKYAEDRLRELEETDKKVAEVEKRFERTREKAADRRLQVEGHKISRRSNKIAIWATVVERRAKYERSLSIKATE